MNLRLLDLPIYRPHFSPEPESVTAIRQAVHWADAFILATPDYHGSMSGAMKNFLDYHGREFAGKLFGYLCTSHERGLTAMDQMRTAVRQCYAWSLPYGVSIHAEEDFDRDGHIKNARLEHRLGMLARDMVVYGEQLRSQFHRDVQSSATDTFAAKYR
jgi:FMN reductase